MKLQEVRSRLWWNTASSYALLAVLTCSGLVTFRLMFQVLSPAEFGFWVLLWSFLGYGMLLDFGLSVTVQKRVAELSVTRDWEELSSVLCTVFVLFTGVAAAVAALAIGGAGLWFSLLEVPPDRVEDFRRVLIVFFVGYAVAWPLGLFDAVLRGQQRLGLSNGVWMVSTLSRLGGVVYGARAGWELENFVYLALACLIAPQLVFALAASRSLKEVTPRLRHVRLSVLRSSGSFSLFVYIAMIGYVLQTKVDVLVVSTCLGVSAVALYQPGAKIGETFSAFTRQLARALQPAAAHLQATADHEEIRRLLIAGMRYSVMLALPAYLIAASYLDVLLSYLTGLSTPGSEMYWAAQTLLLWAFMFVTTHNVFKNVALMCGHEKRLMVIGLLEGLLNAVLSIVLVLVFRNVVCVALGSLLPTLVLGWGVIWGWAADEARTTRRGLVVAVIGRTPLAAIPLCLWLFFARRMAERVLPFDMQESPLVLLVWLAVAGAFACLGVWWIALSRAERDFLGTKARRIRGRLLGL